MTRTKGIDTLARVAIEAIRVIHCTTHGGDPRVFEPCEACSLGGVGNLREALTKALGPNYTKLVWGLDMNIDGEELDRRLAPLEALATAGAFTDGAEDAEADGAPVPFGRAHGWLKIAHEYGASLARLKAHVESTHVRASAPSPKEAGLLVDRVITECVAPSRPVPAQEGAKGDEREMRAVDALADAEAAIEAGTDELGHVFIALYPFCRVCGYRRDSATAKEKCLGYNPNECSPDPTESPESKRLEEIAHIIYVAEGTQNTDDRFVLMPEDARRIYRLASKPDRKRRTSRPVATCAKARASIPELKTQVFFVELSELSDAGWFISSCGAGDNRSTGFHVRAEAESVAKAEADDVYASRVVEYVRAATQPVAACSKALAEEICNGVAANEIEQLGLRGIEATIARSTATRCIAALGIANAFPDEATLAEIASVARLILDKAADGEDIAGEWALRLATAVRKLGIGGGK